MTAPDHIPSYVKYVQGCRCEDCRTANTDRERGLRQSLYAQRVMRGGRWYAPDVAQSQHGLASTYQRCGCRCIPCTEAGKRANARRYRGGAA